MSRIDALIAEHCPTGVAYFQLGDVTKNFDRQRKPVTKSARMAGKFPYYGANGIQDYVHDYIFDGTFLLMGEDGSVKNTDGTPVLNWAEGKIWVNNHAHILQSASEELDLRYLYYYLQTVDISSFVTGGTQPKINQKNMNSIPVAVPPLEVQREIVRILDTFSKMEAELEAELEARKQQYEHYRREVLSFSQDTSWGQLSDIVEYTNGKAHEKLADPEGNVAMVTARFISRNGEANRFLDLKDVLTPARVGDVALVLSDLPNGRALARTFYVDRDDSYAINQRVARLRVKNQNTTDPKFVHYFLDRNSGLLRYDNGFDQTHLSKSQVTDLPFPILPLSEQKHIVAILEKFDAIVNDLSVGLPAELAARRQQYEYYRDKLLTFKELEPAS